MMAVQFVLLVIIVVSGLMFYSRYRAALTPPPASSYNYSKAEHFLNQEDMQMLQAIEDTVGDEYRVFAKVDALDIMNVKVTQDQPYRQALTARLKGKKLDYVVVRKSDSSPICAVRVRSGKPGSPLIPDRDAFLSEVCAEVELPLGFIDPEQGSAARLAKTTVAGMLEGKKPAKAAKPAEAKETVAEVMPPQEGSSPA
ncbi:Protein of unknown function [Ectothiorhodosinus mongolicus]|uniref:DUF2726 domain-containing protein n=1 Tax=Ectothiorhodosinus mongolicus TaxID=233100 RepID=A0A1R3VZG8_9GAMM|nr:DUF2726 domain-containing protein [Ectothiorhodosinus mongolicus]ULX57012.1 DUF2726 domain-containing protein [Ectothiorhodosinus mongolicus]SIT69456.1 Protein of unknown function [Ectothiorhodosinus mongolicus]